MFSRPPLMLITDRSVARADLEEVVRCAVRGGVDLVQVREPGMGAGPLLELVQGLLPVVAAGGGRLVVNDRIDVAIAAGADGIHLKQSSVPPSVARRLLGADRLVGVSTHTAEEAVRAFDDGADYVVFGPVFETPSKRGLLAPRGVKAYREVAESSPGPVLALGGISRETLAEFGAGPVAGLAAVRELSGAGDPEAAARRLREWLSAREGMR